VLINRLKSAGRGKEMETAESKILDVLNQKQYCSCCNYYLSSLRWNKGGMTGWCGLKDLPANDVRNSVGSCDHYDEERALLNK
jgi:hypothetical protein